MSKQSPLKRWLNRKNKAKQLASSTSSTPAPMAIGVHEKTEHFPESYSLSPGQQRLWLLQELNPDNPFYHYAETYQLKGDLNIDKLQQAYRDIVARHDILRTSFRNLDGIPRQIVHTEPTFQFLFHDLAHLPTGPKETESKKRCLEIANAPFDLQKGPLSRLLLLKKDQGDYLLLIVMHHLITDKWSMRVLREELSERYKGGSLLPVEVQYPTYFSDSGKATVPSVDLAYWKEKLASLPSLLALPYDRTRPNTPSYRGGYRKTTISPELSTSLKDAARRNNVTLFVYLLSAYQVLLHRYSGEQEFAVGTPVSNRKNQRLEETIGFFNETIALKADFTENSAFSTLVQNTRQNMMEAFAHMNVPFEDIVHEINPARELGVNPIFQTMFILHVEPEAASFSPELHLNPVPLDTGVTKFDLTLYVADEGEQLSVTFEFSADLFEASTVDRMQGHFLQILTDISTRPGLTVQEINMLSPAEKHTVMTEWNNVEVPFPDGSRIHDLISQVARSRPEEVVAAYAGKQLTYGALEERANGLAGQLRSLGVEPNKMVGLYTDPCLEMIIGIVAILKAGGAYLPLDPEYPQDRIDYLIKDASADLMLTTTALANQLPSHYRDRILLLDQTDQKGTTAGAKTNIQQAGTEDMAYMIYTSGSTGQPKGVMVSHANLVHSTLARHHYYPTQPTAFLLLSSFSFDSSVAGIFWALTTGAKLVLAPRRVEQDLEALASLIADEDVSHTLMLPTLYDTILRFTDEKKLSALKTVIVAGEACPSTLTRLHHSILPSVQLFNEYGPTEASVWCTAYEVKTPIDGGPVPIGRAIPNAKAYVLSGSQKTLCPIGVAGELFIGGKGVTKGYWKRPDLTEAAFFPDPFSSGERIYRTGDRARWLPDGNLQFLGRADHQIKIRGYRIELGEIQEAILRYPGISATVVKVDESQQRLLAYYLSDEYVDKEQLRNTLKVSLPKHMVPAFFLPLDSFPRLANGKVDQGKLPPPSPTVSPMATADPTRSLSPTEATLLDIWRETLSLETIGINDNFFEVGGDSILSIQIVARARKAGLQLSPRALFEQQTIAELALFTKAASSAAIQEVTTGDFPLLPIQQWFFDKHIVAPHHWNQATLFPLPATTLSSAINAAIDALTVIHSGLRQQFYQDDGGSWRATLPDTASPHETVIVPAGSLGEDDSMSAIETYLTNQQRQYALSNAPLLKSYWFEPRPGELGQLVLVAHHLIIDVVSWRIIAEDLQQLLGEPFPAVKPRLAPATAPYSTWSRALKKMTQDGRFAADLAFWKAQDHVNLPSAFDLSLPVTESDTERLSARLSTEETAPLLKDAHRAYNTATQDLLLVALLSTVKADRLHLSLEHNGREAVESAIDFTRSVGWFTSTYPITLSGKAGWQDAIISVKEALRRVPNNGLSYGALQHFGKHDLTHQPPLLFNYLGRMNTTSSNGRNWQMLQQGLRAEQSERHLIWEINIGIFEGELSVNWAYAKAAFARKTMESLLKDYLEAIRQIMAHCLQQEEETFTPSDFPEADLSQDDLDNLMDQIDL